MTILLLPLNTGILLANSKIFNNNNQNGIVDVVMDFTLWLECRQSTTDDKRSECKRQDIWDLRIPCRNWRFQLVQLYRQSTVHHCHPDVMC